MSYKSFLRQDGIKYRYDFRDVKNWKLISDNLIYLLMSGNIRDYKHINFNPTLKDRNLVEIKISFLKRDNSLEERILLFDILGCKDLGYDSEISKMWRRCLSQNFDLDYLNYVQKKLQQIKELKDISC